jgi:hypothetical protein
MRRTRSFSLAKMQLEIIAVKILRNSMLLIHDNPLYRKGISKRTEANHFMRIQ